MKTIKFFTILITPLIAGIACCMIILKVCNINVNSVTNLLLSKIPGINQFVETTTNTGLYAISQMDKKELITSSYNIDFLVSFYQSGKRTIILYPYEVEAGINLENIEQTKKDSLTVITLPNAQITKANLDDKKKNNVIREQVEVDYNNCIIPLKIALERYAKDLAISAGLLKEANKNAEKYLSALFPAQYFHFEKEATSPDTLETLYVPHLPVKFTYQNENLTEGRLNYQKDTIYSRDDLKFRGSRFGYLETNTSSTFKDRDNLILNSDILGLRITDPLNPKGKRIYAKASNLYKEIFICYPSGDIYYLESENAAKEEHLQSIAPDMLYLAMTASDDNEREGDYKYMEWLKEYENTLSNMLKGRYNEANVHLQRMASMHPTTPASWEETLMSSYVNTKCYNKYYPTNGNNDVDLLLKAIYLFDNKKYNEMDDNFQTNLLAMDDEIWTFIGQNRARLVQLFYQLDCTSQERREDYKQQLIDRAENYDHSIALTLKGQDYCNYIHGILLHNDNEYSFYLINDIQPNVRIIGHKENLTDDEFNGFDNICALMKKEKVLKDNEPQLVLAYIEKSSLFTQNHNLLIFEKEHCTICSNITGKWQKKYTYTTTYDQIRSNPINNSFTIGPYSYKGKAISQLIQEIKNSLDGYKKDNNLKDFSKKLSSEMSNNIYQYCIR